MVEATERFLGVAHWLTPADEGLVIALRRLAKELDTTFQAALYSQYRQTYIKLHPELQPRSRPSKKDPLEALLDGDGDA